MATASSRPRSGSVTFAGVLMLLAGSLNLLTGIVALVNDDHFADDLLVGDLNGGPTSEIEFIAVARDHVQLAYEA